MKPFPQNSAILDRLLSEADKLSQMGRVLEAAAAFQQAIEQFPADRRAYYAYTKMLIDGTRFEDGLALLEQIPDDAQDPGTLALTGCCLMGLGCLAEAEACAREMLSHNPGSAPALNLMGQLAYQQGDGDGAETCFQQAIRSDPDYGPAPVNLGILHWEQGKHKAALDAIEKGFIRDQTDFKAATTYHAVVTELGEFERSEAVFIAAVDKWTHNERLKFLLIDVLVRQQKYPAALAEIRGALAVFGAGEEMIAAAEQIKALAEPALTDNQDRQGGRLSVCIIVKNEAGHLAKCLHSVNAVADEIIVVDTGSTDHSKAIAAVFGAGVFDFKWSDDFAKARNFAISKARGEWIFCLDADEVISPRDHDALRKLVETDPGRRLAYSIVTRNYINRVNALGWEPNDGRYMNEEAGWGWFPSEKVRLFPNRDDIRFEYPVHEVVEPSLMRLGIDILSCPIPVHHYGKLDERNSAAKGQRYYRIGIRKLAEVEHNIAALRELAIQAANLEQYADAVSLWHRVIERQPDMPDAFVNLGTAYWNLGNYHEAAAAAKKAIELAPGMKEARFNLSLSLLHLGQAAEAVPILESLSAEYPDYLSARFLMAAALCCAGQTLKGAQGLKSLKRSKLGPGLDISCQTLAEGLRSAGQIEYEQALLNTAFKTAKDHGDVPALSENCGVVTN